MRIPASNCRAESSIVNERERSVQLRFENAQVFVKDTPDDLQIDPEVVVYNPMAQPDDFRPFDVGELRFELLGQTIRGLPDNLEISHDGILGFLIGHESIQREIPGVPLDLFDGFPDVIQKKFGRPSRHRSNPARWLSGTGA